MVALNLFPNILLFVLEHFKISRFRPIQHSKYLVARYERSKALSYWARVLSPTSKIDRTTSVSLSGDSNELLIDVLKRSIM